MKIVATIEARMTSTRLPGKVLLPLAGKPVLERIIERAKRSKYINEIVVATTKNDTDNPIAELCQKLGVKFFRGSENDVLDRVLKAAQTNGADLVCELMGDSPLVDPLLIDEAIKTHLESGNDYTSNFYPANSLPMGFAVQVFSAATLEKVSGLTSDPIDHVHVTSYIYSHPEIFKCGGVYVPEEITASDIRLCVDTKEDYDLVSRVFAELYPANKEFGCGDAVRYLRENPDLMEINRGVKQKTVEEG